ncbi:hypothetical protein PTTG_04251 [Puccinia triticina 1-1 BBBD Race 1]|uniref:Uncharacterized protein n=1 Tax=Puccinia triticina (isolate 1-1 / race 1 (BBBD)) TaxID=630390 RepID=A0A0C4ETX2_PUCT1|nr:hypothetical protein PTTG_04251 [Puccinia triticina 1-1 BBBD Race 1]
MHSWTRINPEPSVGKWPGGPASILSSSPTHIPPPPPTTRAAPFTRLPIQHYRPHDPPPLAETDPMCWPPSRSKQPVLCPKNVIQGGFGSLVEIL